jgi:hypothetical protein
VTVGQKRSAYRTSQEQKDDGRAQNPARHARPEDAPSRSDARILGLFRDVARGVKARQDARREQEAEAPVPARRRVRAVLVRREEGAGLEAVRLGDADGQPDEREGVVEHDDAEGDPEDHLEVARVEQVEADGGPEDGQRHDPLDGTEADVGRVEAARKIDVAAKDGGFRQNVFECDSNCVQCESGALTVGDALAGAGRERGPCRRGLAGR